MKKEFLTDFGLTDDEADKILAAVNDEVGKLSSQADELKKQLAEKEEALTAAGEKAAGYENEIGELKTMSAIKLALTGSALDVDLAASLIDRDKLKLGKDGSISGLDEQIKSLRESKGFLFKPEQTEGFVKVGAPSNETGEKKELGFRDAIEAAIAPGFNN